MKKRRFLPVRNPFDGVYMKDGTTPPTKKFIRSLFCRHTSIKEYLRSDHRVAPGVTPGINSEHFNGYVCVSCGCIRHEVKTL